SGLHRVDEIVAHALVAERDQIARLDSLSDPVGANVRGDDFFAHAVLHHGHDVGRSDGAAELLPEPGPGYCVLPILLVADGRSAESPQRAADQGAFRAVSASLADQGSQASAAESADGRAAIGMAGAAADQENQTEQQ